MAHKSARICILGGGFGGLYTALALAQRWQGRSRSVEIVLIDPKSHFLFTPLLYEQLTGELAAWEIAPQFDRLLAQTGIQFRQDWVQEVDLRQRRVGLRSGDNLTYDYLVIAVGQQTRADPVPGVADHALAFRTLADRDRLYQTLSDLQATARSAQIAIVGSGPNGVELACKLADWQLDAQIYLLDQNSGILSRFPVAVQKTAAQAIGQRGIQFLPAVRVLSVDANQLHLAHRSVQLSLPIDLVVWTTGTQAWEWVRSLPCEQTPSGQLRLRSTLQLLDYPEVFALGDVAEAYDLSGNLLSPTAQVAFQQAKTVAANLTASLQRRSLKPFRYRHQGDMLTLGIGNAVVADSRLHLTGMLASLLRQWVYLTRLPTWRHRLHVLWHRFRVWLRHWVRSTVGNSRRDRAIPAAALMSARRSSHHPSTRK